MAKSAVTALALWTRACDLGVALDCLVAGRRTSNGLGTATDPKRAAALLQRGCDLNEGYSCEDLSAVYQDGIGVPRNPALALELAEKACRLGSQLCTVLEGVVPEMLAKGIKPGEPMPDARANKARCETGHATSCLWLALRYEEGIGVAADADQADNYLSNACQLSEGEACRRQANRLARMGATQAQWRPGKPYDQRFEEIAAKGYEIGCADNDAIACSMIGDMTRRGIGVPKDLAKAGMFREVGCVLDSIVCPEAIVKAAKDRAAKFTPPTTAKPVQSAAAAPAAAALTARTPIASGSVLARGITLYRAKDFQPALAMLLEAAKQSPDDPRVYAYLAGTYDWLGMSVESRMAADTARRLDPQAMEILR